MTDSEFFDHDYYEAGPQSGKSLYQNYRWIPELTIPLAHRIINVIGGIRDGESVMDFGCAKGYLVHSLRLLGADAVGVDVSQYAIDNAMPEAKDYLCRISPYQETWKSVYRPVHHVICKDVLEHVPYDMIDHQLKILRKLTLECILIVVPLGENGKYNVPAYELDKTHHIRESLEWWAERLHVAGFTPLIHTHDSGTVKSSWVNAHPKANALFVCS